MRRPRGAAALRGRRAIVLAGLALLMTTPVEPARAETGADSAVRVLRIFPIRGSRGADAILPQRPDERRAARIGFEAPLAQQPWGALTPEQQQSLMQARDLRINGQLEAARRQLVQMLAALPHHPRVLTELAEVDLARQDWAAVERLARAERAPHRDSLLLAAALSGALERLGRRREAAQVALEAWVASAESGWASDALERLAPAEPGVREVLRTAASRVPGRVDLALLLASLDWRSGDGTQALKTLAGLDGPQHRPPLRVSFAEELVQRGTGRDSSGAADAWLAAGEDARLDPQFRIPAVRSAWQVLVARRAEVAAAPRVMRTVQSLPIESWEPEFVVDVARALRRGGHTAEARTLLGRGAGQLDAGTAALERALTDLRDGPPERALAALRGMADSSPEAAFRYAEALFFAGMADSAMGWYQSISKDASGAWTGASLERIFLIEDANPASALPALGRIAWQEWRGEPRGATAVAESLVRALPPGPTWAHAGLELSRLREASGDVRGALQPLLAIVDSLPGDRLAPIARQRAGDLYLEKLHDERAALAQYEECLARYPKAWNAAEVRRRLESLRRERRF